MSQPVHAPETNGANGFDWPLAYAGEDYLRQAVAVYQGRNHFAQALANRLRAEIGCDFFEWIDYLTLPESAGVALQELGFEQEKVETPNGEIVLRHPRASWPRVVIRNREDVAVIAIRP